MKDGQQSSRLLAIMSTNKIINSAVFTYGIKPFMKWKSYAMQKNCAFIPGIVRKDR